uniref:gliding motility lipoprotein GldB n=1 Tax=Robiginitalea myxolifaciens TaxID=400055 RepID=UPI001FE2EE08|nr:gliding motility lipoprotein GldB [Robiginitalea myxolifaciens]
MTRCGESDAAVQQEILAVPISLEVQRFDREFDAMPVDGLDGLKGRFPFLFPAGVPDSVWLAKQADTLEVDLRNEVARVYPNFDGYQAELELLFKHARYYFPYLPLPEKVITLTTRVDMDNRIILTDSLLLIGLDSYLGRDHEFYAGIDRYQANSLDPAYLVSDVGTALARRLVTPSRERSFLDRMVYHGKILYLKDLLMPQEEDAIKIQYTQEELQWTRENEGQIWRYFIEQELLYDTDATLNARFLDPAPFSKFRLVLDNESPGRIGRYMGWQIVRALMEDGSLSPEELLQMSGEEILRASKYKPPK